MNTKDNNIIQRNASLNRLNDDALIAKIETQLTSTGWLLLRGFSPDLEQFSKLSERLLSKLTFDPARNYGSQSTQKVEAGTDQIGLHIENGNTPLAPDVVLFYCAKSANAGSQTTVCDGAELLPLLPKELSNLFQQKVSVKRTLPAIFWKKYLAKELLQSEDIDSVTPEHLQAFLQHSEQHRGRLLADGSLEYELNISPIINRIHSTFL